MGMRLRTWLGLAGLSGLAAIADTDGARGLKMIENFAGGMPALRWQIVNDGVMGGLSSSRLEVAADGIATFTGTLSLENNGGFASVRSEGTRFDLTGCVALVVRVKGDGRKYQLRVRDRSGWRVPDYRAEFQTKAGEWQEPRLPLADFAAGWRGRDLPDAPPIDRGAVQEIAFFLGDKTPGKFSLEIDWIAALPTPPAPKPALPAL